MGGGPDSDAPEDDSQQELETMPDLGAAEKMALVNSLSDNSGGCVSVNATFGSLLGGGGH